MSDKRWFSAAITNSEKFLSTPAVAQALYFHLVMNADDGGIIAAKPIMQKLGVASNIIHILVVNSLVQVLGDDFTLLITDWNRHDGGKV